MGKLQRHQPQPVKEEAIDASVEQTDIAAEPRKASASTRQTLKMDIDKGKYKKQSNRPLAPIASTR